MPTTIAIIEDNVEFSKRFSEIIQHDAEFLLVGSAINGAEGVSLINVGCPDVLLVDLGLPDMNGIELIKHAKKVRPDCDVVVVTIFTDDANVILSIEAGATGYLLKDSQPSEIFECIRTLTTGGSPINPLIARKILKKFYQEQASSIEFSTAKPLSSIQNKELTERETQILKALSKGLSFKEIGESYFISTHTVARHVKSIYGKLVVHSRGEAVFEATKMGLINI
jgi:DNA-binding NarL/FixJ family response regulator